MKKNIKKTRKIPSLKPYLEEAIDYIKESKNFIYFSITFFIISIFFGILFNDKFYFIDNYLKEIISLTEGLSGIKLIAFILNNNILTSFFSLFLGFFFGLFSLFNTLFNGIIIGYVIEKVSSNIGIFELWRLIPHGIFELPAILISLGLGLKLGTFMFNKKPIQTLKEYLRLSWLTFILVIVPLLTIAAIIEGILISIIA